MSAQRPILGTVAWGLAGLIVVPFLIGYAAPFLPPDSFWWTNLFAVLVPPLGTAVGLLAVGVGGYGVYRRHWGQVGVAAVLLILIAARFGLPLPSGEARGHDAETLRVMTLNVPPSSSGDWSTGVVLFRFVHRQGPDVLALQESWVKTGAARPVTLRRVAPSLRSLLSDSSDYDAARVLPPKKDIQQPVFGRLTIDSTSVHPLPPTGETEARSRYTRTAFTWQGRRAVLYNVHLHSVGPVRPWNGEGAPSGKMERWQAFLSSYRTGAFWRAEQARILRRRIEEESPPVLVVGDFNSTPHQWAYRHIAQGFQRGGGWGRGATYPADRPLVRIDHVLAGPAWEVVATHVPAPYWAISDHRPVVARLRWRD